MTHASPEVANLGPARPPLVYLGAIVLGVAIHLAAPAGLVPPGRGLVLGLIATVGAIALFLLSVRTFRTAGTPVPGNRPTTTIVRSGPYRFTRNPVYLSFSLLQVGLALLVNSAWLLVTLVPAAALMAFVIVPREERYLATRFSPEYLTYKRAVRRWL